MQDSHTTLDAGCRVVVRDERWTVLGTHAFDAVRVVSLRGVDERNRGELCRVLWPFDRIEPLGTATAVGCRSRRTVLAAAARAVADHARWDQCRTAAGADIDLRAWQMEPALAAVAGATRILLADAVGMGKTVQAGLIVSELRERRLAERVLVLTPATLREQWAGELRDRFGMSPAIFDQGSLAAATASLPPGINPWLTSTLAISSIDLVKRPEVRAALDGVPLDVLIVDEAHRLVPGTDRAAVVAELAVRTPWVVLCTATPHLGDDRAFEFLLGLGDVGDGAMTVFRRSAVREGRPRRSCLLAVRATAAEENLLAATVAYTSALRSAPAGAGARLVAVVVARRAASSALAAHRTLCRRLELLQGAGVQEQQVLLPWDDGEAVDDDVPDSVLAAPGLQDVAEERRRIRELMQLAEAAAAVSSKERVLRRLLRRTRESVLVFSEYRDVARTLAERLRDVTSVAALHGGVPRRERLEVIAAFNRGRIRTLVATDAAGEGVNLQASCRLVINVELPWTPHRLEQRIGRVDRIGQPRRVHAIHLMHRDSYEGTVIARLQRRRLQAQAAVAATPSNTHEPQAAMARRVMELARPHPGAPLDGAVYASRAGKAHEGRIVLLFSVALLDEGGRLVERTLVPLTCAMPGARALTRPLLRALLANVAVRQSLHEAVVPLVERATRFAGRTASALELRLTRVLAQLADRDHPPLWQDSLFDRRHEQAARAHAISVDALRRHLAGRLESVRALERVGAADPHLVAAWRL
jgi:superfamily II DNA or RNA helicase